MGVAVTAGDGDGLGVEPQPAATIASTTVSANQRRIIPSFTVHLVSPNGLGERGHRWARMSAIVVAKAGSIGTCLGSRCDRSSEATLSDALIVLGSLDPDTGLPMADRTVWRWCAEWNPPLLHRLEHEHRDLPVRPRLVLRAAGRADRSGLNEIGGFCVHRNAPVPYHGSSYRP